MHELHELKDMLCEELEKYGEKSDLSAGSLDVVDKLANTVKNLSKIIAMHEEDGEYSGNYPMYDDYRYRSYARGRTGNVRRDAMGRYSRATEDIKHQLQEIMEDAPEHMKSDIQKLIKKM